MKNEVYMSGTGNDFICSSYERDLSQIEIISIVGDSLLPVSYTHLTLPTTPYV